MQEDAMLQMKEVLICLLCSGMLALSSYTLASVLFGIRSLKENIRKLEGIKEDMELRLESEYSQGFLQTFEAERGIRGKLDEMLEGAEREVVIICPWVREEGVLDRIMRLRVPVKMLLLDPEAQEDPKKRKRDLEIAKGLGRRAEIRYHDTLHAKVLLTDRKAMLLGSANFTKGGLEGGFESAVYTEDPVLLRDALSFFDSLWEGCG